MNREIKDNLYVSNKILNIDERLHFFIKMWYHDVELPFGNPSVIQNYVDFSFLAW